MPQERQKKTAIWNLLQKAELEIRRHPDVAINLFDKALDQIEPSYGLRAWTLAHRGLACSEAEYYAQAVANYEEALEIQPNYPWALAHLGEASFQLARYDKALAYFNQAIELQSEYSWAYAHRATVKRFLMQHHQSGYLPPEEAFRDVLQDFSMALKCNPYYTWAYANRGLVRRVFAQFLSNRGKHLKKAGRLEEAIEALQEGLAMADLAWNDLQQAFKRDGSHTGSPLPPARTL